MTRRYKTPKNDKELALLFADPPNAARLFKRSVSDNTVQQPDELLDDDLDAEENLGEISDSDYSDDNNQAQDKGGDGDVVEDRETTSKRPKQQNSPQYQGLLFKSDGSNQLRICLALRFLLKRVPELMEESFVLNRNGGKFRSNKWVGSFAVMSNGACFIRLARELTGAEPKLRGVTHFVLCRFYSNVILAAGKLSKRLGAVEGDGDEGNMDSSFRRTFVSDAAMRLAELDREYRQRLYLQGTRHADSLKRKKEDSDHDGIDRRFRPRSSSQPSPAAEVPSTSSSSTSASISPLSQPHERRKWQQRRGQQQYREQEHYSTGAMTMIWTRMMRAI
ncbi:hypothetical protein BGX23_003687 [Mortierella sp. AD031]|nr:hypothetical protein BGX23_003687 [Mortierella sp. AD031]